LILNSLEMCVLLDKKARERAQTLDFTAEWSLEREFAARTPFSSSERKNFFKSRY